MLSTNFIEKLLGLQDVKVTNVDINDEYIKIFIKMEVKTHHCPNCNSKTKYIHSYRRQVIKDIPMLGKNLFLVYRKRRYRCPHCDKCFYEENTFLPHYHRMTNRLAAFVIDMLHNERSFTSVANDVNLSVSTVIRIFDFVYYPKPILSSVLAIDEFKGNTGGEKYNAIITDPENHVVLDILPTRYSHDLIQYFKNMNRSDVTYFISDMWSPYRDLATNFFKTAIQVIDKYHWIRQVVWAFENVRKEEQKKFNQTHRISFKRSKSLLIKSFDTLLVP
ncbi:ISL3 family transposase [Paludicola sp. MB14-C6]|uniref:ISL3 family transposase n=1 Tax=Paludihabitans sp. MB14-C6 TaxID=3070656 RepID=UPI0027DD3591|nr:ISL3 family transposase [Paludicola sp. MB14-C6]WMJ22653.1 ISL3 family transposase [Paludicola sp. MB14-C6]